MEVQTRARHLNYCVAFAEAARSQFDGARLEDSLARIDFERENILAAHAFVGSTAEHGESGLRLVTALNRYWVNRGLLGLGHQLIGEALSRIDKAPRALSSVHPTAEVGNATTRGTDDRDPGFDQRGRIGICGGVRSLSASGNRVWNQRHERSNQSRADVNRRRRC
jgi:hypothetical protein